MHNCKPIHFAQIWHPQFGGPTYNINRNVHCQSVSSFLPTCDFSGSTYIWVNLHLCRYGKFCSEMTNRIQKQLVLATDCLQCAKTRNTWRLKNGCVTCHVDDVQCSFTAVTDPSNRGRSGEIFNNILSVFSAHRITGRSLTGHSKIAAALNRALQKKSDEMDPQALLEHFNNGG